MTKLDFSIPANNEKIISLYNKLKKDELNPKPIYQRKLVWKKQHKINFITTILSNFPFPEIYVAPGLMDTETLELKDQIVDGQQRLTTIKNYIEGKDVFALNTIPIAKFTDLSKSQKEDFLNYEVSVRYLKNASEEQIRDIFQRINSTEYALNRTERLNAQWGESEFVCFAKQMVEQDLDIDATLINYQIEPQNRKLLLAFFHTQYTVFSENDVNRMLALQFAMTLLSTFLAGEYFRRNEKVQEDIERFYEEFPQAGEIETRLVDTINFIHSLNLKAKSYWFNKANIFTLIVECYKFDLLYIDKDVFSTKLKELENTYNLFSYNEISNSNTYLHGEFPSQGPIVISQETVKYYEYAKEGVNEKYARDFRGNVVKNMLDQSIKIIGLQVEAESSE